MSFPSTHICPSKPKHQQMERSTVSTERRKHPERFMMTPAYPVPMITGKCVLSHCFQLSTNHFSKVYNLLKFGQIFLDAANSIFLLQKPPAANFKPFSSSPTAMQLLQKEVNQDVIQRQSFPLNSQKCLEQSGSISDTCHGKHQLKL